MSTKAYRDFRPFVHFTPKYGWINDPNGLTYENGTWHLFAQHYPDEPIWGPMHWLHATSTDLLHWTEHGIALAAHGGSNGGLTAHPDAGNFVLFCEGEPVLADAAFLETMVLAAGDRAEFYASQDLIHWTKTGDFGSRENHLNGVFECTDLFPLQAPDGSEVWVLVVSMALHSEFGGGRMQYFLGHFDGDTFTEDAPHSPYILDSGYDNYAAVTFFGTKKRIMIGWGSSPSYAPFAPTGDFCCLMTYARELSLVETDSGLRLSSKPITPSFALTEISREPMPANLRFPQRYIPKAAGALPGELFHIHVEADEAFDLMLSNDEGEELHILINNEQKLVVDRTRAGLRSFDPVFESGVCSVTSAPRNNFGKISLDLYFDRMFVEVCTDNGTVLNSSMVFPKKPYQTATLTGNGTMWIGHPEK